MKIWTKRAAGVGAVIGGLLVAGTVAASASDLPLPLVSDPAHAVSSTPLSSVAQQGTAAAPAAATAAKKTVRKQASSKASKPTNVTNVSGAGNANTVAVDVHGVSVSKVLCGIAVNVASPPSKATCDAAGTTKDPKGPKGPRNPGNPSAGSSKTNISGLLNANNVTADVSNIEITKVGCGITADVLSSGGSSADCGK